MQDTTRHAHTTHIVQLYYASVTSYEPLLNTCVNVRVCSIYWSTKVKES